MAAAHDARTEPPQALPAPANGTGEGRRTERQAHQTELASGHEQTVSLRQELLDEVGSKQIEHVGGNEAVEAVIGSGMRGEPSLWYTRARSDHGFKRSCASETMVPLMSGPT